MHDRRARVRAGPAAVLVLGVLWLFSAMEAAGAPCTLGEPKAWGPHPDGVCQGDSYEVTSEPKYSPQGCELVRGRSITYRCTLSLDPSGCAWDPAREVFTADPLIGRKNCTCVRWESGSWSPKLKPEEVCQGDRVPEQVLEYTLYPPGCRDPGRLTLPKPSGVSAQMVTGTHNCADTRPRELVYSPAPRLGGDWCKFARSNTGLRLALLFNEPAKDAATEDEPCRIISQGYSSSAPNLIYLMWLHANPAGEDYDQGRGGFPINLGNTTRFEYWRDLLKDGGYGDWCLFDTGACSASGLNPSGCPPQSYGEDPNLLCPPEYYPNPLPGCPSSCSSISSIISWPQFKPQPPPSSRPVGVCGAEDYTCDVGVPRWYSTGRWACIGPNDGGVANCFSSP